MKVLLTGATGFVGQAILAELLTEGLEVIAVGGKSKLTVSAENFADRKVEFYAADISDRNDLSKLEKIGKVEAVIHSAGLAHQFGETKKEEFQAINVDGTKNVSELAVKLKAGQFILIGSTAIYGIKRNNRKAENKSEYSAAAIDEETEAAPPNFYAASKLEAEKVCREICERENLPLTIFRLAPVIGEANVGNVARLIKTIDAGRFVWIGRGENLKSLIYKQDVARACAEIVRNKKSGTEIFNLAAQPISMKIFVREISAKLDKKVPNFSVPPNLLKIAFRANDRFLGIGKISRLGATVEKWLADDVYSADKIFREYGFKTSTAIDEALKKQIDWYKNWK